MSTAPGSDWPATLAAFARHLDAIEAAVTGGRWEHVQPFPVPSGLGPLPARLQDEAARLLARNRAVEDTVNQALERTREQLAELSRKPVPAAGPRPLPAYVDSRL